MPKSRPSKKKTLTVLVKPKVEVFPKGADLVSREDAIALNDMRAELTRLSLRLSGHDELWGALRAAGAAMAECALIASRDYGRYQRQTDGKGQK